MYKFTWHQIIEISFIEICLYHMHLFETFTKRRERLKTEIEKLKEKLKNYKGDKIDIHK